MRHTILSLACYLINGDATGLTDNEILLIDKWMNDWQVQIVSPITDEEGNAQPYFSRYPLFGLPAEVEDCDILYLNDNPSKIQRYENDRPFQENDTDVFGATCGGRCALCQELPQPCQEHRRLRDLHSELCAEKRLQRLHGRGDIRTSRTLL